MTTTSLTDAERIAIQRQVVAEHLAAENAHEYDVPGCSIREVTARGTHSAEFAGVPASGHYVSFEVCALCIFDEQEPDKLIAERAYWDNDGLLRQLKGESVPSLGLADNPRR